MVGHTDFKTWGSNLPDEFLLCRDIGHTWRPFRAVINGDFHVHPRDALRALQDRARTDALSHYGAILSGHYNYAEGYLAPAGTERIDAGRRDGLRLESITRLLGRDTIDHGEN